MRKKIFIPCFVLVLCLFFFFVTSSVETKTEAEVIVGNHRAGFTNLLVAPPQDMGIKNSFCDTKELILEFLTLFNPKHHEIL